ncbi:MAG: PEP-utilizing enzyme [Actinomycetota bacterium]
MADAVAALVLGSGDLDAAGVPPKAALLDVARSRGLPVPAGIVVLDGANADDAAAQAPVASSFAVRSAFGAEDGTESSRAGWFESELRVPADELAAAIGRVRASRTRVDEPIRADVLVMAMVDAAHAGVAFTEPGTYDDIVNVIGGTAEDLVGGREAGERVALPRIETPEEPWARRLRTLLASVRSIFGDAPWDIEWADDGEICWLVQIRPITAPPRRPEYLTLANHAEILPDLPSHLMTSVIAEAGPELFGWYRSFDSSLPADRPFLVVRGGRPLINLTLLEDMLRHLGLPTGLIADSIGGDAAVRRPANLRRLVRKLPVLLRMGFAQIRAVARSKQIRQWFVDAPSGAPTFTAALETLHEAYVRLVTGMFPLSSGIGPPLSILRRLGTLDQHAARHRTITTELADAIGAVARDPSTLDDFMDRFGHRGVYESDVARPRYAEDASMLVTGGASAADRTRPKRTLLGLLSTPIWIAARRPMAARELLRHDAMRAFGSARSDLIRLATEAVDAGQLRTVEDIWLVTADEARRLDRGWRPDQAFWTAREAERSALAELEVPTTVESAVDPTNWAALIEDRDGTIVGMGLTAGSVTGRAWVLDEPASSPPPYADERVVLVARSIDAGWIATMAAADAIVAEIGGDLSHGSILIRELGVPAVTNARGVTRVFVTGDRVTVDAATGQVRAAD